MRRRRSYLWIEGRLSIVFLLTLSLPATASYGEAGMRNIDAEVNFVTNFSNLAHDTALNDQIDQSSSTMTLSWIPVFWYFQLGPVLTSSLSELRSTYEVDGQKYTRRDNESRRGAGLRGKINFADIQMANLVPWVGATFNFISSESRTTLTATAQPGYYQEYYQQESIEEVITEAGLTAFVNNYIGLTMSYAHTVATTTEVPPPTASQTPAKSVPATERDSNRLTLGISTFF